MSVTTNEKDMKVNSDGLSFHGIKIPKKPASSTPPKSKKTGGIYKPEDYTRADIRNSITSILDKDFADYGLKVQKPTDAIQKNMRKANINVDFSIPAFSLIKKEGTTGVHNLAEKVKIASKHIKDIHVSGPFVNIELNIDSFGENILHEVEKLAALYGHANIGNGAAIIIDCSSPNIAKYMSVAHLRSTVIGESLYHIYNSLGYNTVRDNHLGDWGTQFGMLGRAVELWGKDIPELESDEGTVVVKGLFKLYVKMHEEIHQEQKERGTEESSLKNEGRAWFLKLEQGDPKALKLWKWALDVSLIEFKNIYKRLRVDFDYWLGESFYVPFGDNLIKVMVKEGCAVEDKEGRTVVNFDDSEGLFPLTIKKSDGAGLYSTRDLCGLAARTKWFTPKKIVYVVGAEQEVYFKQLFKAFRNFAGKETPELSHVSFGMLSLPEGKMSTRKGNVIFLEDVIEESVSRAKNKILENYDEEIPDGFDVDETAEAIGIGAVIYSDLGGARKRHIKFDWDSVLAFNGNSGPYLQYAYARISSMEHKIKKKNIEIIQNGELVSVSSYEREILLLLSEFPVIIEQAGKQEEPSIISAYLYRLVSCFSGMYRSIHFLNEPDVKLRSSRVRVVRAVYQVLHNGMKLLNMPLVNQM